MTPTVEGWTGLGRAGEPPADESERPDPWSGAAERVGDYLRAMGVIDAFELELLGARVRHRLLARMASAEVEDPLEAAIEEVNGLLDEWLDGELGMAGERHTLLAARAAVLSGAVPGWTARFAGVAGESIAGAIRAATAQPTPEPAMLDMPPSPILLCCYGLRQRIAARLRRLLVGRAPASPHP